MIKPIKALPSQVDLETHLLEYFRSIGLIRPINEHLYKAFIHDMCNYLIQKMYKDIETILKKVMPMKIDPELDRFLKEHFPLDPDNQD